ncbi:MAG: RsmB/NOP family class I SAM-dependent RNA methyltransferase [Actinobacteria bacterium]|nr:MAG: RsmB/NOP family class I SAM-dependent RNA methyltransferase [Actinomycetota bacterium]
MSRGARSRQRRTARSEPVKRRVFLSRIAAVYGISETKAEELFSVERRSSIRVNRLTERAPAQILEDVRRRGFEVEPIPWCPDAYFFFGAKHELGATELFQRGYVYIQNASSLVPVLALEPRPGDAILDVSAAPGGKAAHIASVVGGEAELWLNDAIKSRLVRLREVVETFRVEPHRITSFPGQYVDKFVDRRFDRILLDAQCTGEGRVDLRRPNALQFWSTKRINEYSRLQQRMLMASFKLLEPGGVLVYSTCTISPEENEAPVSHLLEHRPEARLEPIGVDVPQARPGLRSWSERRFHPEIQKTVRVEPTEFMEPFFVARIRKT